MPALLAAVFLVTLLQPIGINIVPQDAAALPPAVETVTNDIKLDNGPVVGHDVDLTTETVVLPIKTYHEVPTSNTVTLNVMTALPQACVSANVKLHVAVNGHGLDLDRCSNKSTTCTKTSIPIDRSWLPDNGAATITTSYSQTLTTPDKTRICKDAADRPSVALSVNINKPPAPGAASHSASSAAGQVTVSWTPPAHAKDMRIYAGSPPCSSAAMTLVHTADADAGYWTQTGLNAGEGRCYQLAAVSFPDQEGPRGDPFFASAAGITGPTVWATGDAGKITATWSTSSTPSSYRLEIGSNGQTYPTTISPAVSPYVVYDLPPAATRYFRLVPIYDGKDGEPGYASATTLVPADAPQDLRVTPISGITLQSIWDPPAHLGGAASAKYRIYWAATPDAADSAWTQLSNDAPNPYPDTPLAANTIRCYKVRADTGVLGAASNIACGNTTPPMIHVNLSGTTVCASGHVLSQNKIFSSDMPTSATTVTLTGSRNADGSGTTWNVASGADGVTEYWWGSHDENYEAAYYRAYGTNSLYQYRSEWTPVPLIDHVSPPASLSAATGPGAGQVTLRWEQPAQDGGSAVLGYWVERFATNTASSSTTSPSHFWVAAPSQSTPTSASFTDSGLAEGSTWYYRVRAINCSDAGGSSPPTYDPVPEWTSDSSGEAGLLASSFVAGSPPTRPDAPAEPVHSLGPGQHALTLAWNQPFDHASAITLYHVYRSATLTGTYNQVGTRTPSQGRSFYDTNFAPGETAFYKVSAENAFGEGPQSPAHQATASGTIPDPATLFAERGSIPGDIYVHWTPNSDGGSAITDYTLLSTMDPGGQYNIVFDHQSFTDFNDAGLPAGTTMYYKLIAYNAIGGSHDSNVASATTMKVASPPTPFATTPGDKQIVLNWGLPADTGGSDVTGYELSGAHPGDAMAPLHTFTSGADSTWTHTSLAYDESWVYELRAISAVGKGDPATTTGKSFGIPSEPTGVHGDAGPAAGEIDLKWSPPIHDGGYALTKYRVYRGGTSDSIPFLQDVTLPATLHLDQTGLSGGTTYYYQVSAWNEAGQGPKSPIASATTIGKPSPPQQLAATPSTPGKLDWLIPVSDGGSPLTEYDIYQSTDGTTYTNIAHVTTPTLTTTVTPCAPNPCWYYATAKNALSYESDRSNIIGPKTSSFPPESIRGTTPGAGIPFKQGLKCSNDQKSSINDASGQFVASLCLSHAEGAFPDLDVSIVATYRSESGSNGALASNWFLSTDRRLILKDTNVVLADGTGRFDTFTALPSGAYQSPPGFYETLTHTAPGYVLEHVGGTKEIFNEDGTRDHVQDVAGNRVDFWYNTYGQVWKIRDAQGRVTHLDYQGLYLNKVTDPMGHVATLEYADSALIKVTLPISDAAAPPVTQFTYTGNYDLATAVDANGHAYITNTYDGGALGGRVIKQTDAKGGFYKFDYSTQNSGLSTNVTDPNGNAVNWTIASRVNPVPVKKVEFMNRGLAPDQAASYTTGYQTSPDLEITQVTLADGMSERFQYDSSNTNTEAHGNLLRTDVLPTGNPGGGALTTTYTYEPLYQGLKTVVSPLGNDPTYSPANGGSTSAARFTTTYFYGQDEVAAGDLNSDGIHDGTPAGRVVEIVHPSINPSGPPVAGMTDGNQGQVEKFWYNSKGQVTKHIGLDGKITRTTYFDSNGLPGDASDTEGMPKNIHDIAPGFDVDPSYTYDANGNLLTVTDANGKVTTNTVDALGRVTKTVAPGTLSPEVDFKYDANGNLIEKKTHNAIQNPDGSITEDTAHPFLTDTYSYTATDQKSEETISAALPSGVTSSSTTTIHQKFGYDKDGNLVLVRRMPSADATDANDATTYVFDERNQLVSTTVGGRSPTFTQDAANAGVAVSDITDPFTLYLHSNQIANLPVGPSSSPLGPVLSGPGPSVTATPVPAVCVPNPGVPPGTVPTTTVPFQAPPPLDGVSGSVTVGTTGTDTICTNVSAGTTAISFQSGTDINIGGDRTGIWVHAHNPRVPPGIDLFEPIPPVPDPMMPYGFIMNPAADHPQRISAAPGVVPGGDGSAVGFESGYTNAPGSTKMIWTWKPASPYSLQNARMAIDFWAIQSESAAPTPNSWKARLYSDNVLVASNDQTTGTLFPAATPNQAREYRIPMGSATLSGSTMRLEIEAATTPAGRFILFDSDRAPSRLEIGNAATSTTYHDAAGRAKMTSDADGAQTQYAYDGYGRQTTVTGPNGDKVQNTYDTAGRVTATDTYGSLNGIGWHTTPAASTTLLMHTQRSYDEAGRVYREDVKHFDPATGAALPDTGVTPGDGLATTFYDYDTAGRVVKQTSDNGGAHSYTYNGLGQLASETDAGGNAGAYMYDPNGQLLQATLTQTHPSASGTVTTTSTALMAYDEQGHLTRSVDPLGQTRYYGYDSRGNLAWQSDALGAPTPDSTGAFSGTINTPGNKVLYSYDGQNRLIQTDREMHVDGTAQTALAVTPYVTTKQEWNSDGSLASQTDDSGHKTSYAYDHQGNLITETFADATQTKYVYDAAGNLVKRTDAAGHVIAKDYDNEGHPIHVTTTGPATQSTLQTIEYDSLGRVTKAFDNNDGSSATAATDVFTYDSMGFMTGETQNTRAVTRAYDGVGDATSLTYPNARVITKTYDPLARLLQVKDGSTTLESYAYGTGQLVSRTAGNGVTTSLTYDADQRLASISTSVVGGQVLGFSYQYDRNNQVIGEEKTHAPTLSQQATYDSLGRLTGLARSNFANLPTSSTPLAASTMASTVGWTLDGANNWNSLATTQGGSTTTQTRTHDSLNAFTGTTSPASTRTFDSAGNSLNDGKYTYTWDAFNRLRTATNSATGQVSTYTYDALNRRVSKVASGVTTTYTYDGANVIEERNGAGTLQRQFVHGQAIDEPILMDRNLDGDSSATGVLDQRLYYTQDRLGSVTGLMDATGHLVEGYLYEAYGKAVIVKPGTNGVLDWGNDDVTATNSAYGNPYGYTGQRLDAETGLDYYRARYYDADAGRFLSRDPIGIWGDPSGSGNGYAYVGSSPTMFGDPSGLFNCQDGAFNQFISGLTLGASCLANSNGALAHAANAVAWGASKVWQGASSVWNYCTSGAINAGVCIAVAATIVGAVFTGGADLELLGPELEIIEGTEAMSVGSSVTELSATSLDAAAASGEITEGGAMIVEETEPVVANVARGVGQSIRGLAGDGAESGVQFQLGRGMVGCVLGAGSNAIEHGGRESRVSDAGSCAGGFAAGAVGVPGAGIGTRMAVGAGTGFAGAALGNVLTQGTNYLVTGGACVWNWNDMWLSGVRGGLTGGAGGLLPDLVTPAYAQSILAGIVDAYIEANALAIGFGLRGGAVHASGRCSE